MKIMSYRVFGSVRSFWWKKLNPISDAAQCPVTSSSAAAPMYAMSQQWSILPADWFMLSPAMNAHVLTIPRTPHSRIDEHFDASPVRKTRCSSMSPLLLMAAVSLVNTSFFINYSLIDFPKIHANAITATAQINANVVEVIL